MNPRRMLVSQCLYHGRLIILLVLANFLLCLSPLAMMLHRLCSVWVSLAEEAHLPILSRVPRHPHYTHKRNRLCLAFLSQALDVACVLGLRGGAWGEEPVVGDKEAWVSD